MGICQLVTSECEMVLIAESMQRDFHLSSSATKCFPTVHYKSRYLIAMIQYTIQNINVFASFTNHMYACGHTRLYS